MDTKQPPVIIQIERTEGENSIGFSVRGSIEWMQEMEPFINYNCGFFLGRIQLDENYLVQGRTELIAAFEAMKERKSYQGEIITLTLSQEEPK